jgi:hypothetical protein
VGCSRTGVEKELCSEQRATACNKVAAAPNQDQHVIISHGETLLLYSAEEQETDGDAAVCISLSPGLRASLKSLGMTDGAFVSWETFHVSPVRAMLYFFVPISMLLASLCYLQFAGVPLRRLYFTIPCLCTIGCVIGYTGAIWRYGPAAAKSRPYLMSLPVSWICWCTAFSIRWDFPHSCIS